MARGAEVLDLGTSSGALALEAACLGARVTAVDISWRAVLSARFNAMLRRPKIAVRQAIWRPPSRDGPSTWW
ncbi:50S ribosomal protein L11 methyltransferase [Streptomyces sp. NBC_01764]|uniref:50S ribosomal protein L11 methyltransferase n=1 Tax=Streptomyces sp. NBC_01764 TaxID=2975935 RepID=UPI00224F569A|nr:50S ribosomal protein L11 methyltransferase [Streptomyces sp. NBC_01764]MCX4404142.1 50S ribosomal protein L11 methyltransferase [Streptomyces sp. NBC_01764]